MSHTRINIPYSYGFFETAELTQLRKTLAELKAREIDPRLLKVIKFILKHAEKPNTMLKVFEEKNMPFPFGSIGGIDQFFEVSENYKETIHMDTGTLILHGLPHHPLISINRICRRYNGATILFPFITITQKDTGTKEYFFVGSPLAQKMSSMLEQPQIAGLEFARDKSVYFSLPLVEPDYWDNNGMEKIPSLLMPVEQQEQLEFPSQTYDQCIDPIIIDQFSLVAKKFSHSKEPLTLLDAGAGNGRLAKKILSQATAMEIPVHYLFLEPSAKQLDQAKTHLADEIKSDLHTIRFINNTLMNITTQRNIHCIISCGGPLNAGVVTLEQAPENLKKMQSLLADKGVLIATGYSGLGVVDKHFKEAGFSVLTYAVSYKKEYNPQNKACISEMFAYNHFPCYVAEKIPTLEPKQERSIHFFRSLRDLGQQQALFAAEELEMLTEGQVEIWRPGL